MSDVTQTDIGDFSVEFAHCFTGECRVNVLPILYQIGLALTEHADFSSSLATVLDVMSRQMKMTRGMLTFYDHKERNIFIHESFGLSEEEKKRGIYMPGEGVIGQVFASGKAIVIRHLDKNPLFLNRTGAHSGEKAGKAAFICIPILHSGKVLGTIAAERIYINQSLLKQDVELLTLISLVIAPAAELFLSENIERVRLERENRDLKNVLKKRFKPDNIIGSSKVMQDVYGLIEKVAGAKTTVLILGESGVGKELVANAIHYNGPNAMGPFIKSNCAALPEHLAESELFGHERGAFTGAVTQHKGSFELADGGTIFLDEVGELSPSVQAKLLRVLQNRTFERIGGGKPIKVDVRIIAATNRNLSEMVERGTFREDLFYRLNVFPIMVPPLRERGGDVTLLANYFVEHFAKEMGKEVSRISGSALSMLMNYYWPGNVRELENVIERSILLTEDDIIHSHTLPPSLQTGRPDERRHGAGLESRIGAIETEMIVEALRRSGGHIGDAAIELGLTRRKLGVKMVRLGISYKEFRGADMDDEF